MTSRAFPDLLAYLESAEIASAGDLKSCAPSEIAVLEERYQITLPESYRTYLETMGHESGRLLTHDHYAATYEYVLQMTGEYREDCEEFPEEPHVKLPADALIIVGRLAEQFLMIRCNDPADSPVWYFNEYDATLKQSYDSVLDWLFSTADEAREAIEGGYYDTFPDGTRP
ncbi:MAG: SMI1/KNR4 family protein [Planctomycetaceae bacterium]|nr:SMI1/KNR4 family protein [Planctomycetaceae bacterium]